jgi:AcrR family transcriptional regulator
MQGECLTELKTKRQQRAAATADQLLAAARQVFEARGYQAATVGAITQAANTAHGTFYLYFRNKEDAFGKVMAQVVHEMYTQAGATTGGDARASVAAATEGFLDVFRSHLGLWRCLIEGMHQSKAIQAMWLDLRRPFLDRIARSLERSVAMGAVRPMNTVVAAHALAAMTEWFAFAHLELDEPSAEDVSPEEVLDTLTDLWFHAVYSGAPGQPTVSS